MRVARQSRLVCAAAVGVLLAWSTAGVAGVASTAAFTVELQYDAAAGCPDVAVFKAVVAARLDHDPFAGGAPDRVLVRMAPRGGSIAGLIEWRDAGGNWTGEQTFPLVTSDCLRLARAMGFALAVQIQLLAGTRSVPRPAVPEPEVAPADAAPRAVPTDGSPAPRVATPPAGDAPPVPIVVQLAPPPARSPQSVFALGAGPAVGFGLSSTPILLGRVVGIVAWPSFSLELAAALSLPATTRREDGAGFTQQQALASAAACRTTSRWSACLLANAGGVRMVGKDIDRTATAWVPLVEAGARVGVRQAIGSRAYVTAYADGLIMLSRWTASLDQFPVWTAPRFAAVFGVDACVRIP